MPPQSAGLLLYRRASGALQVLLVHPGGPFWRNKDLGAWSLPKGLYRPPEDALAAARREFAEETGFLAEGPFQALGEFRLPGGKRLGVWAVEGEADPGLLRSNTFSTEWPPRSGRLAAFPEVDRAAWFDLAEAARRITRGQVQVLDAFARQQA